MNRVKPDLKDILLDIIETKLIADIARSIVINRNFYDWDFLNN